MGRVLPILFNTDMVLAILDGRKTVTRRVVKKSQCMLADRKEPHELDRRYAPFDGMTDAELVACTYRPPYKPGDTLYVRETWCNVNREGADPEYYYYADTRLCEDYESTEWKWCPSIHMPKEATRIWLRVTDVRAERLQEIENVYAEGIYLDDCPAGYTWKPNTDIYVRYTDHVAAMAELWDSTISKEKTDLYGWAANPWVWVIEFERCEKMEEKQNV